MSLAELDACQCSGVSAGLQGQLHAVWKHRVSKREAATIVQAQIPVLVLHGRHDILAMPCFGEQLAHRSAHCPDRSQSVPACCSAPLAIHPACQLNMAALQLSHRASMSPRMQVWSC